MAFLTLLNVFWGFSKYYKGQPKIEDLNTDTKAVESFSFIKENVQKKT